MSASPSRNIRGGVPWWVFIAAIGAIFIAATVLFSFVNADPGLPSPSASTPGSMSSGNPSTQSPSSTDEVASGKESPGCKNKTRWQETDPENGGVQIGPQPDHDPTAGENWHVPCTTMNRIINIWFQGASVSGEHKLLLSAGCDITFKGGGGSMWSFLFSGEALGNYQQNGNTAITLDELRSAGVVSSESNCNGSSSNGNSDGVSNDDNGQPGSEDGCTTTNKQTTPDELVEAGSLKPLNILHRIDAFGYSGWSLTEFYTLVADKSDIGAHRVPTIGYVGQPRQALNGLVGIWFGEGSAWDYGDNGAQCSKDFALKWATFYAVSGAIEPGRLDNGNSGVVVTMDDCKLYNNRPDLGWNHENIQALLNEHLANMATFPCMSLTDSKDGSTYQVTPGAHDLRGSDQNLPVGPDNGQCGVVDSFNTHGLLSHWKITTTADQIAVVNYWNNKADPNPFYKFLLEPSSSVTLVGGGDVTFFPASCAESDAVQSGLHTLDQGMHQKLVDVSDIPSKYKG